MCVHVRCEKGTEKYININIRTIAYSTTKKSLPKLLKVSFPFPHHKQIESALILKMFFVK